MARYFLPLVLLCGCNLFFPNQECPTPHLEEPIQIYAIPDPSKAIDACAKLPFTYREVFTTAVDNQITYEVDVLSGRHSIGKVIVDDLTAASKGVPRIEVRITATRDGKVIVEAREEGTDHHVEEELGPVAVTR